MNWISILNQADRALTRRMHGARVSKALRGVARATTQGGSMAAPLAVGAVVFTSRRRLAWQLIVLGCVGWTLGQALKVPVQRERPYEQGDAQGLIAPPQGTSMPSGHSVNTAMYSAFFAARATGWRRLAWLAWPWWIGYTRIVLGVHYLGDILAGLAIGWLGGSVARHLDARWQTLPKENHD